MGIYPPYPPFCEHICSTYRRCVMVKFAKVTYYKQLHAKFIIPFSSFKRTRLCNVIVNRVENYNGQNAITDFVRTILTNSFNFLCCLNIGHAKSSDYNLNLLKKSFSEQYHLNLYNHELLSSVRNLKRHLYSICSGTDTIIVDL